MPCLEINPRSQGGQPLQEDRDRASIRRFARSFTSVDASPKHPRENHRTCEKRWGVEAAAKASRGTHPEVHLAQAGAAGMQWGRAGGEGWRV